MRKIWSFGPRLTLAAAWGLALISSLPALAAGANSYAAPADFNCDGRADVSRRLHNGTWVVEMTSGDLKPPYDIVVGGHGNATVRTVAGDYDGDCRADLSVKRADGTWSIDYAADGLDVFDVTLAGYGPASSVPVPADYDGDGRTDLSVKDANGVWYIDYAISGFGAWNAVLPGYGPSTSVPVPADYDGDGLADLSVKDSAGVWYIDFAGDGFGHWNAQHPGYGPASSLPVPADYDGDGSADLSIKSDDGSWFIDYASDGFGSWDAVYPGYGSNAAGDPVPADYDGDGKADISIKSDDEWWYTDFAADGFGHWNREDPLWNPKVPTITLLESTSHSLKVRVDATGGDPDGSSGARKLIVSVIGVNGANRTVQTGVMTQTFGPPGIGPALEPDTEYCVQAVSSHVEKASLPRKKCFRTTAASPPSTGTTSVSLQRQIITQGPVPYFGTWGPINGARPVRLHMAESVSTDTFLHFLRAGHSTVECFGPNHQDVTVTLRDGGSLGLSEIALLFGGAPPQGQGLSFVACLSTNPSSLPDTVFFNLDWAP